MKQKILTLLIAVFMIVVAFSVESEAAETEENKIVKEFISTTNIAMLASEEEIELVDAGYCGEPNVMWGLTPDGILLIGGEGTMSDYLGEQFAPWDEYRDYIYAAVIDGTVNNIGAGAFRVHRQLVYVYVGEGVKEIGNEAFRDCASLEEIELPSTLKTIGNTAFRSCKFQTINLPNSITSIGTAAFLWCKQLESVQLPSGIKEIAPSLFSECTKLSSVTIANGVTAIHQSAFAECEELETIRIPSTVTTIGNKVFYSCNKLKKIEFPNSVSSLGESMFFDCTALEYVDLPDYITKIPTGLLQECRKLKSVEIPNQVTQIGDRAFQGCHQLQQIRVPKKVDQIGSAAFRMCYELKKISIVNEDVRFLDEKAFEYTHADFVLRCIENSTAHTYAVTNKHAYEFIDMSLVTECFVDIVEREWYKDAVQYVFDKGLMSGSGEYFNPTKNMTRAQLVTTLYRLAGSPEVTDYSACHEFSDVLEGQYYTEPVCWAYNEGITTGSNGMFNISGNLTRQQLAAFFFRYANAMGYDTTQRGDYSSLLNADQVADYAQEAMEWAVGAGLISGSKTTDAAGNTVYDLNPQGNTTRAQLATILQRFCEKYEIFHGREV